MLGNDNEVTSTKRMLWIQLEEVRMTMADMSRCLAPCGGSGVRFVSRGLADRGKQQQQTGDHPRYAVVAMCCIVYRIEDVCVIHRQVEAPISPSLCC
jgi:hypothetical protein